MLSAPAVGLHGSRPDELFAAVVCGVLATLCWVAADGWPVRPSGALECWVVSTAAVLGVVGLCGVLGGLGVVLTMIVALVATAVAEAPAVNERMRVAADRSGAAAVAPRPPQP